MSCETENIRQKLGTYFAKNLNKNKCFKMEQIVYCPEEQKYKLFVIEKGTSKKSKSSKPKQVEKIQVHEEEIKRGNWYEVKNEKTDTNNNNFESLTNISPNDDLMFLGLDPVVKTIAEIPKVNLQEMIELNQKIEIFITEIHSPYKFWFSLAADGPALKKMMQDMQIFYSDEENYDVIEIHATKGRVVAAPYDFVWHRALIIESLDDALNVKVLYIDYGTIRTVPIEDLRYLRKEYGELKISLMRGRLALVYPEEHVLEVWSVEGHWMNDAILQFHDLVYGQKLTANVYGYEKNDDIYHVVLFDERYPKKFCINTELARTHCKLVKDFDMWPHTDELYPTFDMLEGHDFPTYKELFESKDPFQFYPDKLTMDFYLPDYIKMKRKNFIGYKSYEELEAELEEETVVAPEVVPDAVQEVTPEIQYKDKYVQPEPPTVTQTPEKFLKAIHKIQKLDNFDYPYKYMNYVLKDDPSCHIQTPVKASNLKLIIEKAKFYSYTNKY